MTLQNKWITADYPELIIIPLLVAFVTGQTYATISRGNTDFTAIGVKYRWCRVLQLALVVATGSKPVFSEDNGEKAATRFITAIYYKRCNGTKTCQANFATWSRTNDYDSLSLVWSICAFSKSEILYAFQRRTLLLGAVQYRYGFGSQNSGIGKEFEVVFEASVIRTQGIYALQ